MSDYDYKYELDEHGVICQINPRPFEYTDSYIDTYHQIGDDALYLMSKLRFDHIKRVIKFTPETLLDIGYGSGSFLKYATNEWNVDCYGNDICKYALPKDVQFAEIDDTEYDLITMFDVIEHFHNLDFLSIIRPEFLAITVPWVPTTNWKSEEFQNWKHRKPNEHVRHFDARSLKKCIESYGYNMVSISNAEDPIRKPEYTRRMPQHINSSVSANCLKQIVKE